MVPTRSRRENAGRNMQQLIQQQLNKEGDNDEFYSAIYGGFKEVDQDDDFESPPHSSDDERLRQKQMLERDKNWAIARINKMSVPENSCDPKTQRQRLEEAKKTAVQNIESLKRFEQFELERKKRQQKAIPRQILHGPRIKEMFTADGKHLVLVPELLPNEKLFPKPKKREFRVCSVKGKSARYMDPITRLPYADVKAFQTIRDAYRKFIVSEVEPANDCKRMKM
uniref:Vacuolar protein sorting-associated protein 72 homolog n=1 Tax=Meloidogyne javanica TaxID=6303 RepID=A0A915N968_MELJA